MKGLGQWTPEDAKIVMSWPKDNALQYSLLATWQRVSSYTPKQIRELLNLKNFEFWGQPSYALNWSTLKLDDSKSPVSVPANNLTAWLYIYNCFLLIAAVAAGVVLLRVEFSAKHFVVLGVLVLGTVLHLILVVSSRYSYPYTPALFVLGSL
jgi:hypothetical protein